MTRLVFGSGHTATRVVSMLSAGGFDVAVVDPDRFRSSGNGIYRASENALASMDMEAVEYAYLVDDRDDKNIEFLIAVNSSLPHNKIVISLSNHMVAKHISSMYESMVVVNPGEVAAPEFVESVNRRIERGVAYPAPTADPVYRVREILTSRLAACFLLLLLVGTVFFHVSAGLGWVDSLYFVVVTVSTVGYGDISVLHSGVGNQLAVVLMMLLSMLLVGLSLSAAMNTILRRRETLANGIRRYKDAGHVVVCGLGRVGIMVVDGLLKAGYRVVVVESSAESPFVGHARQLGASVYIGDATMTKTLQDVGVSKAAALLSLVNSDARNLEIALNGRSIYPGLMLVLRIYERDIAEEIRPLFDIHRTLSVSEITARDIVYKTGCNWYKTTSAFQR